MSPNALISLIRRSISDVEGVARMGVVPPSRVGKWLTGSHTRDGILVHVDDAVSIDVYLVAHSEISLLQLGEQIQATVGSAIQDLAGMDVREVNVFFQDVEAAHG